MKKEKEVSVFRFILVVVSMAAMADALGLFMVSKLIPFEMDRDNSMFFVGAMGLFGLALWSYYVTMLPEDNWIARYVHCEEKKKKPGKGK